MKTKEKNKGWYYFVICFFIYCIIGWIYEVIWEFKVGNGFVNKGFLHGPYLPVYGFGMMTLYFILRKLLNKKEGIWKVISPIFIFVSIMIIVSTIEYFTSVGLEKIFNMKLWDYSYDKFNLNGRISLRNSTLLTVGAELLLYIVQPILDKNIIKMKPLVQKNLAISIIIVMVVDLVITLIEK